VDGNGVTENGLIVTDPDEAGEVLSPVASVPPPGLAKRLRQAMEIVEPLVLDGENAFHHYRYPTIAQVREVANRTLAAVGISIIPSVVRVGRATREGAKGKTISVTAVEMEIAVCAEDGAYIARWVGESEDVGDKGVQKAVSNAIKSWLANLLLIPVESAEAVRERREAARDLTENAAQQHWIDNPKVRARFWRWVRDDLALNDEQVYNALGVERIHDFGGTMADAKRVVETWIAEQVKTT
jgi:hypothetical protein